MITFVQRQSLTPECDPIILYPENLNYNEDKFPQIITVLGTIWIPFN